MTEPNIIRTGLDLCAEQLPSDFPKDGRIGLLMNQASVTYDLQPAYNVFSRQCPGRISALFSPQHGMWGEQQANMIETPHTDFLLPAEDRSVPLFSLYSETRRPTDSMLASIDVLVIDLQDVGTRIYTFIWTMLECLRACAEANVPVVVLDRPNPLGGISVEGPQLSLPFRSFVGNASIPLRHNLTIAELALLLNHEEQIDAELQIVRVTNWRRDQMFDQTARPWVWPSPNMQRFETAVVYPGQVLLEGTNLSEGRGTTLPFEVVGAPWLDERRLLTFLHQLEWPGLLLRDVRFQPTFDKWQGQTCRGIALHVVDAAAVRSVRWTVALLAGVCEQAREHFAWLPPPYEYETVRPPIDILFGNSKLREALDASNENRSLPQLLALTDFDEAAWHERIRDFLLYD